MKQKLNNFSFRFLLPVFLLTFAIANIFSYLKSSEFGILNLDVRGDRDQLFSARSGVLLKGDIVYGKFHSSYPNLGIVSMRFYNQDRDSDDTLVFRIKEEGKDSWYYEAKYKTDQFMPHKHFPFGFPIISDSDGKNYEFQIESLRGATGSGILIDSQSPVFIAKSSFNRNEVINDKKLLLSFLGKKAINIFGDKDLLLNNLIYFLPLIYYAIFVLSKGVSFQFLTGIALAVIFYDTFWLKESYGFLFIGLLFLWTLISRRFHYESRISGVFSLGFLVMTPILLIFGQDVLAEKSAVWAYLFLCVTVVQQIYEFRKKPKNLFTLKKFRNNLFKFDLDQSNRLAQFIYRYFKPTLFLLALLILFKSGQKIFETFKIYQLFYPNEYFYKFLFGIIFPVILLIVVSVLMYIKKKKYLNKIFYIFLLFIFVFSIFPRTIIRLSTNFQYDPTILNISPNDVIEAWTDVTIIGQNFRDKPFVGKVLIDNNEQRIIDWTNTKVVFRTNPTITKSGILEIETDGRGKTNQYQFNYLFIK